ncbi:DUF2971 domain-containing protein [Bacillus norwichensis]|uniref:DUF2971 domain-containing protein n=1 Tax=Bacillus norwichensis TaxID=2762217 RepID=A0ABR8VG75_9BACI|nr:DUF2971 domain-containing protein [Bacillus norwichensis]MBD8003778.1 DUF2971 domain-containing protein [Bacillus norwichensis]
MSNLLYHYCSIETFELILKNKTFRFSSLGIVDDMEESVTLDFDDIGRICFVSCWTDLEQESVEMWRNYTGGNNGVRIGLPKDFFHIDMDENSLIPYSKSLGDKYDVSISPPYLPELMPVTYTQDEFLINLPVANTKVEKGNNCSSTVAGFNLDTRYIGRFKRDYWSGQSEWRYRLIAVPQEYHRNNLHGRYLQGEPEEMIELMKSDLREMSFKTDYIDYYFSEIVFHEMEILLSPLNNEEDNLKVKEFLKEHTGIDNAELKKSKLKIRC